MTTKEKLMQASDTELPALLGEVLQPEMPLHLSVPILKHHSFHKYKCSRCGTKSVYDLSKDTCSVRPSIPLTPANAFKWRDWAAEKYGASIYTGRFFDALSSFSLVPEIHYLNGIVCKSQPKHYLIAAAICHLNSKETDNE